MHLILTGATGLVGAGVLDAMMKTKGVTKISILSRRPVKMAEDAKDPRINVIIHKDFETYDAELLSKLRGAKGCVWALGISQAQVGKEEYIKITKDYALAASRAFETLASSEEEDGGDPFHFVYVSGLGATLEPRWYTQLFARVKGETEAALAGMTRGGFHALSVRPGAVDPATHDAVQPYVPTRSPVLRAMSAVLSPATRMLAPGIHSPTEELGRVFTQLAMGRHADQLAGMKKDVQWVGNFPILENPAIRRLAALSEQK